MRLFVALLSLCALILSPVVGAAAGAPCDQFKPMASATPAMPGMAQAGMPRSSADPCCDHGAPHKRHVSGCAQACAGFAAVAALPPAPATAVIFAAGARTAPVLARLAPGWEPPGLLRPPRSGA